jgi:ABC-type spermidine/putrescine transport system permease subunit I
MKNTSKFQNVVIATIVGWLVLFVFLPNLMIIATSFDPRRRQLRQAGLHAGQLRACSIRSITTCCCIR